MKRKLIVFCTILVIFAVILSRFTPDKNFSGLHDVTTALENHGYQVAVQEAEKNILRGERYCLTLNHEPDFMVTVYVYDFPSFPSTVQGVPSSITVKESKVFSSSALW